MNELASGYLVSFFSYSVILTIPVSLLLLARYRRELLRGMLTAGGAEEPRASETPSEAAAPPAGPRGPLPDTRAARRRLVALYTAAALASSAVTTTLLFTHDVVEAGFVRVLLVGYATTWPLAATLPAVLALSRRRSFQLAVAWYLLGVALAAVCGLLWGDNPILEYAAGYTAIVALMCVLPWAIVLATGSRKLRPVSPIVLAGMLVFSFSALFVQRSFVAAFDVEALRGVLARLPWASNLWFLLASLPVGLACWLLARWLGRHYEAKRFSDTQLTVDTWWLIAAFSSASFFAVVLGWWGLLGLGSFVAYRLTLEIGFRLWPVPASPSAGRRLLLLRVFGFRKRTERLFDAIGRRWRFTGSVQLITGTDLAGRTVDPGEMIRFLSGDIDAQFVRGRADLERRLEALDVEPDPDGRFRVNDFSCHDDTWKAALGGLLERSDVVLMDLRGFREERRGARFELEELARTGRLATTLFVVDDSTDVGLLRATLGDVPDLHLARVERQSAASLEAVESRLLALAGSA